MSKVMHIYTFRQSSKLLCGEHKEAKIYDFEGVAKGYFDDEGDCLCQCPSAQEAAMTLSEQCADISSRLADWQHTQLMAKQD